MLKRTKNIRRSLPEDIKQVTVALAVSLCLLISALILLISYLGDMADKPDTAANADQHLPTATSSLTTYAAMISPAAPGTNGVLAGACLPFSLITDGMGGSGE